jgi:hypothetical protein
MAEFLEERNALAQLAAVRPALFAAFMFGRLFAHSGDDGRSFHAMAGKDSAAWWAV